MKKIFLTLAGFMIALLSIAQSPNLMNYQGVARNAAGNVLPNQPIGMRLSILNGGPTGAVVYSETRTVTTNGFGLFNVVVGSPGAITTTGTIAGINWTSFGAGSGTKYLQVELDATGGTNYFNVGSTQLVSVPYSLNAGAAAPVGPAGGDLTGTYPNPTVAKLQGRAVSAAAPANKNLLMWDAVSTSWIPATAAAAGVVSGTGTLNMVAKWTPDGVTIGNSQIFDNGTNVGVGTLTPTNKLEVTTAGTTSAGSFSNTNAANTTSTLAGLNQGGSGAAVEGTNTGTGRGGFFQVLNAASTADAVRAETNGTGASWGIRAISSGTNGAGLFQQTNPTNTSNNVQSTQAGLGRSGFFTSANAANTANALEVNVAGAGAGIASISTGTGNSGFYNNTNAANAANTVLVDNVNLTATGYGNASEYVRRGATSANTFLYTGVPTGSIGSSSTGIGVQGTSEAFYGVAGLTYNGSGVQAVSLNTGTALYAQAFGTGLTANFVNANTANASNTVRADNANVTATGYGNNTLYARRGATSANTFLYTGVPTGMTGSASAGIGVQGTSETFFGVAGLTYSGTGVQAVSINTGSALVAQALGTGYAFQTSGKVQIQGQGAALNSILRSDAVGNATWATLASVGGVSGTGTLNFVPKWSPDGTTLGNSLLFDDGTNVGIGTTTPTANLQVANANLTNAGDFNNNNAGNGVAALRAFNNAANIGSVGMWAISTGGSGYGPIFPTAAIGESFSQRGILGVSNANWGVHGASNTSTGVVGESYASTGNAGVYGGGLAVNNFGVVGNAAAGTGAGGYFTGGTTALRTLGGVQLTGIGEAAGRVLTTDAVGNATWQASTSQSVGISIRGFTAQLTVPSGILTPITQWFVIDNEDGGANYNGGTGEYTITKTGVYQVNAAVGWAPGMNATDVRMYVLINGVADYGTLQHSGFGGGYSYSSLSYSKRFLAGQKISISLQHNSGVNQNTQGPVNENAFSVQFLHN